MSNAEFVLYVVGRDGAISDAVDRFRTIFDEVFADGYDLTVVDIAEDPERAETDGVVATPTLIRERPEPRRRFVGYPDSQQGVQALLGRPVG